MEPSGSSLKLPVLGTVKMNHDDPSNVVKVKEEPKDFPCEWPGWESMKLIWKSGMPADIATSVKTELDTHTDEGVITFYSQNSQEIIITKPNASSGECISYRLISLV